MLRQVLPVSRRSSSSFCSPVVRETLLQFLNFRLPLCINRLTFIHPQDREVRLWQMCYKQNGYYEYIRTAKAHVEEEQDSKQACIKSLCTFAVKTIVRIDLSIDKLNKYTADSFILLREHWQKLWNLSRIWEKSMTQAATVSKRPNFSSCNQVVRKLHLRYYSVHRLLYWLLYFFSPKRHPSRIVANDLQKKVFGTSMSLLETQPQARKKKAIKPVSRAAVLFVYEDEGKNRTLYWSVDQEHWNFYIA